MRLEDGQTVKAEARGKLRNVFVEKGSSFLKRTSDSTKLEPKRIKLSPKVGDSVSVEIDGMTNYIMDIDERKNDLERPDIANVDQAILTFAARDPEFNFILLDRFLAIIEREDIKPVIVITKVDLLSEVEYDSFKEIMAYYQKYYDVYYTSSKKLLGVKDLETIFKNKISVLTGQTGSGKSSLLNALIPGFELRTQETSKALGRGKHTTRCTSLYDYLGGMIADTPGFSSLEFGNILPNEVQHLMPDIFKHAQGCKYKGCLHISEPGCLVIKAFENNEILKTRYENYKKFINDTKERKRKY